MMSFYLGYLAHVGGVLQSLLTNRVFTSNLYNVFHEDNVNTQLAALVNSGLSVLVIWVPNQLTRVLTQKRWNKYYTTKLPPAQNQHLN